MDASKCWVLAPAFYSFLLSVLSVFWECHHSEISGCRVLSSQLSSTYLSNGAWRKEKGWENGRRLLGDCVEPSRTGPFLKQPGRKSRKEEATKGRQTLINHCETTTTNRGKKYEIPDIWDPWYIKGLHRSLWRLVNVVDTCMNSEKPMPWREIADIVFAQ